MSGPPRGSCIRQGAATAELGVNLPSNGTVLTTDRELRLPELRAPEGAAAGPRRAPPERQGLGRAATANTTASRGRGRPTVLFSEAPKVRPKLNRSQTAPRSGLVSRSGTSLSRKNKSSRRTLRSDTKTISKFDLITAPSVKVIRGAFRHVRGVLARDREQGEGRPTFAKVATEIRNAIRQLKCGMNFVDLIREQQSDLMDMQEELVDKVVTLAESENHEQPAELVMALLEPLMAEDTTELPMTRGAPPPPARSWRRMSFLNNLGMREDVAEIKDTVRRIEDERAAVQDSLRELQAWTLGTGFSSKVLNTGPVRDGYGRLSHKAPPEEPPPQARGSGLQASAEAPRRASAGRGNLSMEGGINLLQQVAAAVAQANQSPRARPPKRKKQPRQRGPLTESAAISSVAMPRHRHRMAVLSAMRNERDEGAAGSDFEAARAASASPAAASARAGSPRQRKAAEAAAASDDGGEPQPCPAGFGGLAATEAAVAASPAPEGGAARTFKVARQMSAERAADAQGAAPSSAGLDGLAAAVAASLSHASSSAAAGQASVSRQRSAERVAEAGLDGLAAAEAAVAASLNQASSSGAAGQASGSRHRIPERAAEAGLDGLAAAEAAVAARINLASSSAAASPGSGSRQRTAERVAEAGLDGLAAVEAAVTAKINLASSSAAASPGSGSRQRTAEKVGEAGLDGLAAVEAAVAASLSQASSPAAAGPASASRQRTAERLAEVLGASSGSGGQGALREASPSAGSPRRFPSPRPDVGATGDLDSAGKAPGSGLSRTGPSSSREAPASRGSARFPFSWRDPGAASELDSAAKAAGSRPRSRSAGSSSSSSLRSCGSALPGRGLDAQRWSCTSEEGTLDFLRTVKARAVVNRVHQAFRKLHKHQANLMDLLNNVTNRCSLLGSSNRSTVRTGSILATTHENSAHSCDDVSTQMSENGVLLPIVEGSHLPDLKYDTKPRIKSSWAKIWMLTKMTQLGKTKDMTEDKPTEEESPLDDFPATEPRAVPTKTAILEVLSRRSVVHQMEELCDTLTHTVQEMPETVVELGESTDSGSDASRPPTRPKLHELFVLAGNALLPGGRRPSRGGATATRQGGAPRQRHGRRRAAMFLRPQRDHAAAGEQLESAVSVAALEKKGDRGQAWLLHHTHLRSGRLAREQPTLEDGAMSMEIAVSGRGGPPAYVGGHGGNGVSPLHGPPRKSFGLRLDVAAGGHACPSESPRSGSPVSARDPACTFEEPGSGLCVVGACPQALLPLQAMHQSADEPQLEMPHPRRSGMGSYTQRVYSPSPEPSEPLLQFFEGSDYEPSLQALHEAEAKAMWLRTEVDRALGKPAHLNLTPSPSHETLQKALLRRERNIRELRRKLRAHEAALVARLGMRQDSSGNARLRAAATRTRAPQLATEERNVVRPQRTPAPPSVGLPTAARTPRPQKARPMLLERLHVLADGQGALARPPSQSRPCLGVAGSVRLAGKPKGSLEVHCWGWDRAELCSIPPVCNVPDVPELATSGEQT